MARIVAIMLILCKFFFQLFRAVHPIPRNVLRDAAGTDRDGFQDSPQVSPINVASSARRLLSEVWMVRQGYGAAVHDV